MTDVAGPPAPPERFSSSPIRGADAATGGSTDGSDLDVNCSMAQVFEIPSENRTTAGHQAEIPQAGSQIAVPFRTDPSRRIDSGNMGRWQAHRKHANIGWLRLAAGPKPGAGAGTG